MMKNTIKVALRLFAILGTLLAMGIHFHVIIVPLLGVYKFYLLSGSFVLLLISLAF